MDKGLTDPLTERPDRVARGARAVLLQSLKWLYVWGAGLCLLVTVFLVVVFVLGRTVFLGDSVFLFLGNLSLFAVGFGFFRRRAMNADLPAPKAEPWFIALALASTTGLIAAAQHPLVFVYAICATPIMARMRQRRAVLIVGVLAVLNIGIVMLVWQRSDLWFVPLLAAGFQQTALLFAANLFREWRSIEKLSRANRDLSSTRELLQSMGASLEKSRIARDLHDISGHKLTAAKLQLDLLQNEAKDPQQQERIVQVRGLISELMKDLRHLVIDINPDTTIDLASSLQSLTNNLPGSMSTVRIEANPHLRPNQAEVFLRVAQEGVTNALRHAQAEHLTILLGEEEDFAVLQISDDGIGFDTLAQRNLTKMGLKTMEERLRAVDGTLEISSGNTGTTLTARLPIDNNHAT